MIAHVRVDQLTVGDVLVDGAEVTMLGPSSLYPGERFISARTPGGGRWTTSLGMLEVVQVDTRFHTR